MFDLWLDNLYINNVEMFVCAAIVKFVKETIGADESGKCAHFQAVPGCGLKCTVSNIEGVLRHASKSEKLINFTNCIRYIFSYIIYLINI